MKNAPAEVSGFRKGAYQKPRVHYTRKRAIRIDILDERGSKNDG